MVQQLSESKPTARKQHRCSLCNGVISPGETYSRSTNIYDGRVYDFIECGSCVRDRVGSEVYDWSGCPDEGYTFEDAYEWAHDSRHTETRGEMARAWLARCGCTCEVCAASGGAE